MREGGGTSNILQSSLKLLLLMTIEFDKFFLELPNKSMTSMC
jgi:hypothetical protein